MAPLYPLLTPTMFLPAHLAVLTTTESILLLTLVSISARYSPLLTHRGASIHAQLAARIREQLGAIMDGDAALRHVSSVEALLLLSEWPLLPRQEERRKGKGVADDEEGRGETTLVQVSNRYDSVSWGYIGTLCLLCGRA